MRTIILYGELGRRFGKYHRFAVKNVAEAIRALRANFGDFTPYMSGAHLDGVGFRVFVGRASLKQIQEIHDPSGSDDSIRIVPVVMGASDNPILRVFVGAALIVAGAVLTATGVGGPVGTILLSSGIGMVIGGVAGLLTSTPVMPPDGNPKSDQQTSYLFSGPVNTAAQGGPVPIGYGRMIIGSKVVSAGMETVRI